MNWRLLSILAASYTLFFFLQGLLVRPGLIYLRRRFQEEFGRRWSEQNIASLSPEDAAKWEHIYRDEYGRTPYRWIEVAYALFHYPSIIVLGAILRQPTLSPVAMFFVSGTIYVTIFYFLLRQWVRA